MSEPQRLEVSTDGELHLIQQGDAASYRLQQYDTEFPVIMFLSLPVNEQEYEFDAKILKYRKAKLKVSIEFDDADQEYEKNIKE